ncbi:Deoxyribodipyrimidine photo-lyase-related protein [Sedimentisphaera cyanobacteriorum]|uniref:Deoxyribodipyrimidine photo-lyase-related protein n=1 Tax=Sedimentisphaera cyanobacteriorum TaxID=1940790 RepID=A0A1Q2HQV9_9BACT|nr:cryptochrome/photolyase family protein [Sedimentisphaera cyanobacteriorum]AQQ09646.1 Deoxyribodipyrimidine photo-lyase-related protein [Sedimentisphaera cyanobacteriorum]
MANARIIFPNQLFEAIERGTDLYVLVEDFEFFRKFRFHKKKLIFHRASMKFYEDYLKSKGFRTLYLESADSDSLGKILASRGTSHVEACEVNSFELQSRIESDLTDKDIALSFVSNPSFIQTKQQVQEELAGGRKYSMTSFYIRRRKQTGILLDSEGKAEGGKWSWDPENRKKLPKGCKLPEISFPKKNRFVQEAEEYVNENFPDNPGETENFFYPVTFEQTRNWLSDFIENRLHLFGPYEDAISKNELIIYHSLISPLLNAGLITPEKILSLLPEYSPNQQGMPISSLEGFIRQIIGWREFMRGIYLIEGSRQKKSNFWGLKQELPPCFYSGTTGIPPFDDSVRKVQKNAYCHHIERLMVLGNFMLLCGTVPLEVYRWFMEMFIDAYEWVMVPNVFGMSQYSDGGLITTKPYISSSNYIRKMRDYPRGQWCEIWDGLYWRFVSRNKAVFENNPRMKIMAKLLDSQSEEKFRKHIKTAEDFLNSIF